VEKVQFECQASSPVTAKDSAFNSVPGMERVKEIKHSTKMKHWETCREVRGDNIRLKAATMSETQNVLEQSIATENVPLCKY
jgi:hypothetical protein